MTGIEEAAQVSLVERCKKGDREAVGQLFDMTFDAVYAFAYRFSGCTDDAEDITSETYERALRALARYEVRDASITAWLIGIARRVAHEHARFWRRTTIVPLADGGACLSADDESVKTEVNALMECLTAAQREVVVLRLAGFKLREIAQLLGKAEGTVKALQSGAFRRMRNAVSEWNLYDRPARRAGTG
jgi:RNA polymerase sigma-70 factor (ECF subfamily)